MTSQPAGVVAFGIYESGADSLPVKHLMGVGTHTKREGYETCSDAPHDEAVFGGDGGYVMGSVALVREVARDTYLLGTRSHNFFVLRDGDEVTIVDAGCSGEWSKLVRGLESVDLSLEAIAGVVATHSHADHFGLAHKADENDVPVFVHDAEESRALGTYTGRYAASASEVPIFNLHALRTFLPLMLAGVMKLDHLAVVGTFQDGDRLDLPGHPVAVHTPGHTEGHTMFHCSERGLLFTGDGLITKDLIGPRRGPQMIEQRFSLDHQMALSSLDRIVDLEAKLLLPGHGDPWEGSPAAAVSLARS